MTGLPTLTRRLVTREELVYMLGVPNHLITRWLDPKVAKVAGHSPLPHLMLSANVLRFDPDDVLRWLKEEFGNEANAK